MSTIGGRTPPPSSGVTALLSCILGIGAACYLLLYLSISASGCPILRLASQGQQSLPHVQKLVDDGKGPCDQQGLTQVQKLVDDGKGAYYFAKLATITTGGYEPDKEQQKNNLPLKGVKGSYWWENSQVQGSFSIAKLDATYPKEYFQPGHGHPIGVEKPYIHYVMKYGETFLGRKVNSIVELGNGGGYYARFFHDILGDKFLTVEGTGAGIAETLRRGVPVSQVLQHDLRMPLSIGHGFDMALCTEVAEHVEPVFSSQIVLNLVTHADMVWFSHAPEDLYKDVWVNHPNERPRKMWVNLFEFYGYRTYPIPQRVVLAIDYRGNFIAYNTSVFGVDLPSDLKHRLDNLK